MSNFAQRCAKDLAPYNVRVNTLNPGMVNTPLNQSIWRASNANLPPEQQLTFEQWSMDKISRVVPLKRWQEPAEFADMALFFQPQPGPTMSQARPSMSMAAL